MALALVKRVSVTHSDPVKDQRGCYKRGDPVLVYEDWFHGHCNGGHVNHSGTPAVQRRTAECQSLGTWTSDAADLAENPINPAFYLVRVTGATAADLAPYMEPAKTDEHTTIRRLYELRVDDLPGAIRTPLEATGYTTVPFTTVQQYLRNKVTG